MSSYEADYEIRVGGKYRLTHKLGCGSFSTIYLASDIMNEDKLACKMELINSSPQFLIQEAKMLKSLSGLGRFPEFKWYGEEGDYNWLLMGLLGPSLDDLFYFCDKQFSLKTGLILFDQALQWLELLHENHIIHRDIKPENFWIGVEEKSMKNNPDQQTKQLMNSEILHILDLGLSKYYRDPITQNHIEFKEGKGLNGTPRYWSINAHKGYEQSRRDDLQALGYVIIYFLKGSLPWQGIKEKNKDKKSSLIWNSKEESIRSGSLFENLPWQFKEYFDLVLALKFDETPNYSKLRRIMKELFYDKGYSYNFDWQVDEIENEEHDSDDTQGTSVANQYDEFTYEHKIAEGAAPEDINITERLMKA